MKFNSEEVAIIAYALGAYRGACMAGEKPTPKGGVEAIDGVLYKMKSWLEEEVAAGEYGGIGTRHGECLCQTCRTIIEGQLRNLLERVPGDKRSDLIERALDGGST